MPELVDAERECPSCAMNVPADAEICPYCAYEFPTMSSSRKWMAWVFALLLLLPVILILRKLLS